MEKNIESTNQTIEGQDTLKSSADAVKILADLGNEALETGKISDEITIADQESTSEYLSSLKETLNAINLEIKECVSPDEKSLLYKQREDVMNRMKEEKENQRHYNENREDKNRNHSKSIFAVVATVAIGAGGFAAKYLLDTKRT